jgi:hypothetical protein
VVQQIKPQKEYYPQSAQRTQRKLRKQSKGFCERCAFVVIYNVQNGI